MRQNETCDWWELCIWWSFPILSRIKISKNTPEWNNVKGVVGVADPTRPIAARNSVRNKKGWQAGCRSDHVLVKSCPTSTVPLWWVGGKDERLLMFSVFTHAHTVLTAALRWWGKYESYWCFQQELKFEGHLWHIASLRSYFFRSRILLFL